MFIGKPVKRWTMNWARQLLARFLHDPDYRAGVLRRSVEFAFTGVISPDLGGGITAEVGGRKHRSRRGSGRAKIPMAAIASLTDYEAFIRVNAMTPVARQDLASALALRAGRLPRLSLVTPLYNTPPDLLESLIASIVRRQHQ